MNQFIILLGSCFKILVFGILCWKKKRKERENVNGKRNLEMLNKIFVLDFVYIMSFRVNSYDIYCIFKNYFM